MYCFYIFTVVKTTVLLADIKDWPAVNVIYEKCKLEYRGTDANDIAINIWK